MAKKNRYTGDLSAFGYDQPSSGDYFRSGKDSVLQGADTQLASSLRSGFTSEFGTPEAPISTPRERGGLSNVGSELIGGGLEVASQVGFGIAEGVSRRKDVEAQESLQSKMDEQNRLNKIENKRQKAIEQDVIRRRRELEKASMSYFERMEEFKREFEEELARDEENRDIADQMRTSVMTNFQSATNRSTRRTEAYLG